MREYVTDAVVLDREEVGEADLRIALYTERFGRVSARATSARKITSKLAAHLEPFQFTALRLIARRGSAEFQVVDALATGARAADPRILRLLHALTPEGETDPRLWHALKSPRTGPAFLLALLGFDPSLACCEACGRPEPRYFFTPESRYFCTDCAVRLSLAARPSAAFVDVGEGI